MAYVNKSVAKRAAYIAGAMPEMDIAAAKVAALVKANAERHRHNGILAESIYVVRGKVDRHVTTSDKLAMHKEFGHLHVNPKSQEAFIVRGIFVFTNAARSAAA